MKKIDNCKIYTNGRTTEVIEKLNKLGFKFSIGAKCHINSYPFIYIVNNAILLGRNMEQFMQWESKEVSVNEIINFSEYPLELMPLSSDELDDLAFFTFIRLHNTAKEWNRIDNYKPNWSNDKEVKACISKHIDDFIISNQLFMCRPFTFKDVETAKLFLKTFKTDFEICKDLL